MKSRNEQRVRRICLWLALWVLCVCTVGCQKEDTGPQQAVTRLLENAAMISNIDPVDTVAGTDPNVDPNVQSLDKARSELDKLFIDSTRKNRILGALRLYRGSDWEYLKTIEEPAGTFVVFYLRSQSTLMGQPVPDRPGWRKALFRLEQSEGNWFVADLDYVIQNFGDKPIYKTGQE